MESEHPAERKPDKKDDKKGRGRWALEMGGKSLFAIIPALMASYFSFREAKLTSDVEIARINAKAGAGYEALADAVKSLETEKVAHEEESKRLAAYVTRLEVRLDGLVARVGTARPTVTRVGGGIGGLGRGGGGLAGIGARSQEAAAPAPAPPAAAPAAAPAPVTLTPPEKLFNAAQKPLHLPKTLEEAYKATR